MLYNNITFDRGMDLYLTKNIEGNCIEAKKVVE